MHVKTKNNTETVKSDKTWKGQKIINTDVVADVNPQTVYLNTGVVYAERNGVGYCYRNGEVVHTFTQTK